MRPRRASREQELDRELRAHLELEAEAQQDAGLPPEQARYAALRAFGNLTLTKEEVRRMWGWTIWDIFIQDFRYAWRILRKSPGFAATAILTLALGIGASTAVFTVVDSVVLRPLAYHDSGSLVVAWERVRFLGDEPVGPNPRHVDVWRKRATAFTALTVVRNMAMGLSVGGGHPRLVGTVLCLPNLFEILRVKPLLGRGFLPEDGVKGHDKVAILTYPLWQSLFYGDPGAIGKTIRIDDTPLEVIGVLPAGFHFPNANALRSFPSRQPKTGLPEPAVFFPVVLDVSQIEWNGNYGNWIALGRLKPGVGIRQAEAQLTAIQAQVLREMPTRRDPGALRASLEPMQEAVVGDSTTGLWLLMAAVMGLMLIACLNLANAQLGRALARRRDAAVRTALGAARGRLLWNALAENLVLAAVGGTAGVLVAVIGVTLFRRYSPVDLPRLAEVHVNVTVLLFALGLTLAASLLSGIWPALRLLSTDPQPLLQQNSSRALGSKPGHRLRTWLVGVQVFGCTVLLLVTGLFAKSLLHLLHQDKGFETEHVAVAEVKLPPKLYGAEQKRIAFIDAVLENLRAIPGVQAAGLVSAMPLEGESWIEFVQRVDRPNQEGPLVNARWVSPGYFEATRQKLVAGRFFEERDRNLNSVVLSEGEAKALWGSGNPIGHQVRVLGRTHTVIGVVADSRGTSLKSAPARMAYVHYHYRPPYTTFFLVRGTPGAEAFVSGMRQAVWKHAPDVTIARVKTLDAQLSDSLAPERFQTWVLTAFGIAALLLAMLGIYGVLSYSVAARKQEIGVRIALGATRGRVYALTFTEAGVPVLIGLAAGLIASLLAGRAIRSSLYGTDVVDAAVMLIVTGLFLVSAAAAAFVPARRASCVNPMDALRSE
ncbi:MAG: ABC transporter permease [Acidobacteria bacterium]|nr:ABC transporter permease [Acidobacteriota bacterium]